jgi:hypothetical protein
MTRKKKPKSDNTKVNYPRHTLEKVLRLPEAIINQNAGKECSDEELAKYLSIKYSGPFSMEIGSAIKFSLLERPSSGKVKPTEIAKKIIKPQTAFDRIYGLREALLHSPVISEVYNHYRNENLPDPQFFDNAIQETFKIPPDKVSEFKNIFLSSLKLAELIEDVNGKTRIIDVTEQNVKQPNEKTDALLKLEKTVKVSSTDSCFVMMSFAKPTGDYYEKIYAPAIQKAGLNAIRADDDIFGTGKIVEQIWTGINDAKVLVADLTGRNPNVFYELGLAHALDKPVVLVCANESDVPFDLRHIRVIYFDVTDPFWGQKLIDKVAENILSAVKNPDEAKFKSALNLK